MNALEHQGPVHKSCLDASYVAIFHGMCELDVLQETGQYNRVVSELNVICVNLVKVVQRQVD